MPESIIGTCAITKEKCKLLQSHIYPKFIFNILEKGGGKRTRILGEPNRTYQDGIKMSLLGEHAEQEFSKRERWFAENIFVPFYNGQLNHKVYYQEELYYFSLSLLWRVLYFTKSSIIGEDLKKKCNSALEEWRVYLNGGCLPDTFCKIYMLPISPELFCPIPSISYTPAQWNEIRWYLRRLFDSTIFDLIPQNKAFFCKIPDFFFWAILEKDDTDINYGIRIKPDRGSIDFKKFNVGNGYIKDYILLRIIVQSEKFQEVAEDLSDEQQCKIIKRIKQDEKFFDTELGELLINKGIYGF